MASRVSPFTEFVTGYNIQARYPENWGNIAEFRQYVDNGKSAGRSPANLGNLARFCYDYLQGEAAWPSMESWHRNIVWRDQGHYFLLGNFAPAIEGLQYSGQLESRRVQAAIQQILANLDAVKTEYSMRAKQHVLGVLEQAKKNQEPQIISHPALKIRN